LQNEVLKLEKAQQQQKQNEETLKELNNTINDVRRDVETIEERRQVLRQEIHQLESEKQDLETDINMKAARERERLVPEIERMEQLIAEIHQDIGQSDLKLQKEEKESQDVEEALAALEKKKEDYKEQIEQLQHDYLKERDEPNRLSKTNENLRKQVEHVKSDLDKLVQGTKLVEQQLEAEQKRRRQFDEQRELLAKEQAEKEVKKKELVTGNNRLEELQRAINAENMRYTEERVQLETELKVVQSGKKDCQEKTNHFNKRIDDEKKAFKKTEYESANIANNIKELETQTATTGKFLEEKRREAEQLLVYKKNLEEEQQIFVGQLVKKGLEEKNMQAKIMKIRSDILQHEKQVQQFQEEENKWVEEIKFLSTIREKMARTASQAMA